MQIEKNQLKGKPKQVGTLDGQPVMQCETKGGLFIIMAKREGKPTTLGLGSHPAIAAHVAERDNPTLKLTELSKAESLDPLTLRTEAAKFEPLLKRIKSLE